MNRATVNAVIELAHTLRAEGHVTGWRGEGEGCYSCKLLDAVEGFLGEARREKKVTHGEQSGTTDQEISRG